MGWDGMGWDGMGWDRVGIENNTTGQDCVRCDRILSDGRGQDRMKRDGINGISRKRKRDRSYLVIRSGGRNRMKRERVG